MKTGKTLSNINDISLIKELGYDCIDYQNLNSSEILYYSQEEFEATLKEHKRIIEQNGITVNQCHGPWRYPPRDATEEERKERFEIMARSIEGAALLGSKYWVVHPIMPFGTKDDPEPQRLYDINVEFFKKLTVVAEKYGVIICLENMPMPALSVSRPLEILKIIRKINSPYFKACLDTGHSIICGVQPADAVRQLRDSLACLHVHDNDGKYDKHWLPFMGVIDWEAFCDAMRETGFNGAVSMEVKINTMPDDIKAEYERLLFKTAEKLAK